MAKGKATATTAKKGKAAKPAKPGEVVEKDAQMGAAAAPHAEVNADVEVAKGGASITPTGKCEVVEISKDKFRLFNEVGQAVSPIVGREDLTDAGKKALSQLQRQCARMNALQKGRAIRTPVGHADKQ